MSFKFVHELEKLPGKIANLEREIGELQALLSDPDLYVSEPERFDASSRRLAFAQGELDAAELRWLELEQMRSDIQGASK